MGIKDLWNVLTPYFERKPLYELQNKTVAIDLSCWVVEAKHITEYEVQPRMYLRNLYFRTCYLLLLNVKVVFVLEGIAPELKHRTIADRNKLQFKGCKPKNDTNKPSKGRTRFNHTLKQCEEMLRLMGLACITAKGEAEATCAYLNSEGLIDGCISQDSDCFAYGATVVYRNFSISQQGPFASSAGAVDVYNIQKSIDSIDFGRNKIIAMALLCGSDYTEGVRGIGKDSALKLFERFSDKDILTRMRSWRTDTDLFETLERDINDRNKCANCGHIGKIQGHTRSGCLKCGTSNGCQGIYREEYKAIKNELCLRSKAITDPDFPSKKLIKEFMETKDSVNKIDLVWKQPDVLNFIMFTVKYLDWEELYAFEKIFPILTRWQLLNSDILQTKTVKNIFYPDYIKKIRNPKGIPSYEIIWKDANNYFKNIISEEQLENIDRVKLFSTVEPQELVRVAYKDLVEIYEQSKIKPKKPSKRKVKNKKNREELTDMLLNTSISEPKPKTKRTCKKKANKSEVETIINFEPLIGQTKINTYFNAAIRNSVKSSADNTAFCMEELNNSLENLDVSKFGDEEDLANLSGIIDKITKTKPSYLDDINVFEITNNFGGETEDNSAEIENYNVTNFFINSMCENDLFEQSMHKIIDNSTESENSQSVNNGDDSSDDCFIEIYKPLSERIASKKQLNHL